ncbi:MAG TPA: sulfatase-like hydrolase/transferase [Vicinamibacterales bacterium]|jgi:hypothetical protein|nr:sulfatase-like hydrolase/transferase [Vicinamibacterales bacterium]
MRRQVLIVTALVIAINAAAANLVAHQSPQRVASNPNVVLIIMDDMGYGDIGSYGVSDARTPNLDRLAREGVRLTESYANGANCHTDTCHSDQRSLSAAGGS